MLIGLISDLASHIVQSKTLKKVFNTTLRELD